MSSVIVDAITKRFGNFTAVNNVSFTVSKGEIFGLLGPNGAGKSTIIKMLCGLLQPDSGSGSVGGYDILEQHWDIKTIIGYMSQKFSLYDDLTVEENLTFYGTIYGLSSVRLRQRMLRIFELADMKPHRHILVKNLPPGIKQRVSLGTALLHDPHILFLDEPTSGVDPLMRQKFWEEIYTLAQEGKTIFVTTHYMDEAEHCSRLALIISGTIIALDTPYNLKINLPYTILTISTDHYLKAYNLLAEADYIIETTLFGTSIHAVVQKRFTKTAAINGLLRSNGIHDAKIEIILPSLDDVFVMSAKRNGAY